MIINNIFIIFFLLTCMISSSAAQADNPKIQSIVDSLIGLDNSSNVVLSIDCSGTMANEMAKNAALSFLDQLKDRTEGNINVGYVAWSVGILDESPTLSSSISDVYQKLNNSNLKNESVTCMRNGLDESIKLLRRNEGPGKHNNLIVISDGIDNCTPNSNLNCDNINQINTTRIDNIYIIQIGNSLEGRKLLRCLENNSAINVPLAYEGKTEELSVIDNSSSNMAFKAEINNGGHRNPYTNMTVSKEITWGDYGPRITLTIKAPAAKDIKTNIAIAVDSSGSLGLGGRTEYGDNVRKSVPYALKKIKENNPQSNVSIISWDDNIDFAYGPINISDAINYIYDNEVFMKKIEGYPYPLNDLLGYFSRSSNNKYYYCYETESTNLSVGLDSARTILGNNSGKGDGIRKLIILITARSEFTPCNQTITDLAKKQNCYIHAIGIGVASGSLLERELKDNISSAETNYHYSAGSDIYNNNVLSTVIEDALLQFNTENISNNLTIEDTLYPYIQAKNDTIAAKINDIPLVAKMVPIKYNSDGTTTWNIILDKNLNIKPNAEIKVTFDTALNMSLPVDATRSRTSIAYSVDQKTPRSIISYRWLGDNHTYEDPLPECSLDINGN